MYVCLYRQGSSAPSSLQSNPSSCCIVFESALLLLFSVCQNCLSKSVDVKKMINGSLLCIAQICSWCYHSWVWESQPIIGNVPAGNISISAEMFFAGALPTKAIRIFNTLNCCCITPVTFFWHQKQFLHPAISRMWKCEQQDLLSNLRDQKRKLILAGDGRAESPGQSAKYGFYTLIEMRCNKVLDYRLVQVCPDVTNYSLRTKVLYFFPCAE